MPATGPETPLPNWSVLEDIIWSNLGGNDNITPQPQNSIEPSWKSEIHLQEQRYDGNSMALNQISWSMPIPISANKRLREGPCYDGTVGNVDPYFSSKSSGICSRVPWNESVAPTHLYFSDGEPTQSPDSSVILKLRLNLEDGKNLEDNKRAKLGTDAFEYGVQGLCQNDSIYQGNNMEVINSSCHFSLSDINTPEEDLDLYEEERMGPNFLKHGWETSRRIDMDRLLQNNARSQGLLWSPPSVGYIHSPSNMDIGHPSPESLNEYSEGSDINMKFISCCNFSSFPLMTTVDRDSKLWDSDNLGSLSDKFALEHSLRELAAKEISKERKLDRNRAGLQNMKDDATLSGLDFETQNINFVTATNREFGKKPNKHVLENSLADPAKGSPNTKGKTQSLVQTPQSISYVHMGLEQNAASVMSNLTASSDRPHQRDNNYQHSFEDPLMQHNEDIVDLSSESFEFSSYIIPDEKVRKLHCDNNVQNKITRKRQFCQSGNQQGIHVQKKQIVNQGEKDREDIVILPTLLSPKPNSQFQSSIGTLASETEASLEWEDEILEATVFRQLQNTLSKLSINTRLCIRDALYRLARSARQRHMSSYSNVSSSKLYDGICGTESSDGHPISSDQSFWEVSMIETETNQIDRSIADLLFQKPQTLSVANSDSTGMPLCSLINSVHPLQAALKTPNSLTRQGQTPSQNASLIIPSAAETVLKDEGNNGFSPINVQLPDQTSKPVIHNRVATGTPLSFRNKNMPLGAPFEHLIFSLDDLEDVKTVVKKNHLPFLCQDRLSNINTSVRYGKGKNACGNSQLVYDGASNKIPYVMKIDEVSEDVMLLDNAMGTEVHLQDL